MPRRRRNPEPAHPPEWERPKMLALLAGAVAVVALLAAGLVAAVLPGLRGSSDRPSVRPSVTGGVAAPGAGSSPAAPTPVRTGATAASAAALPAAGALQEVAEQDAVAQAVMPDVGDELAHTAPVSLSDPGAPILLPAPATTGPAGVATGFPQTPAGAMAQLAAIDTAVLQAGSLDAARAVAVSWIAPGGPTPTTWSTMQALAQLFTATGLSGGGSPRLAVTLTPLMGQVKGSVGASYVVPCLDFEIDVTLASSTRGAVADCQRMVWTGDRWMIGAGAEPAPAPAVWPDTDTSIEVGYRDLRRG